MILILIIVIILILSLVYILMPKNYGYNKKAIEVFKENDLYEQIKDKKIYSKTLEEAINQNSFNKEYFLEYLDIKYIDDKDFISNINKLLNLGYSSKDINAIYEKIPNSVSIISTSKYNKDIINIMNLSYFKIDNLNLTEEQIVSYSKKNKLFGKDDGKYNLTEQQLNKILRTRI